jgi:hypothetical protein
MKTYSNFALQAQKQNRYTALLMISVQFITFVLLQLLHHLAALALAAQNAHTINVHAAGALHGPHDVVTVAANNTVAPPVAETQALKDYLKSLGAVLIEHYQEAKALQP